MFRVYYRAQNCNQAGKVEICLYENGEPDESGDLRYVEAETPEKLKELLQEDIRIWSRQTFNAERAWQIKWRENVIAAITEGSEEYLGK